MKTPPRSLFTTPFSKTARETKTRICNLFQFQKKRPSLLLLVALIGGVTLSGSLISCQQAAAPEPTHTVSPEVTQPLPDPTPTPSAVTTAQPSVPDLNTFFHWDMDGSSWEDLLQSDARFYGNSLLNPDEINLDYSILHGSFTHTMELPANAVLDVALEVEQGTLGLAIQQEDGTILYQNEDVNTSQFFLDIPQSGSYQVTITGYYTEGSIHLQV